MGGWGKPDNSHVHQWHLRSFQMVIEAMTKLEQGNGSKTREMGKRVLRVVE